VSTDDYVVATLQTKLDEATTLLRRVVAAQEAAAVLHAEWSVRAAAHNDATVALVDEIRARLAAPLPAPAAATEFLRRRGGKRLECALEEAAAAPVAAIPLGDCTPTGSVTEGCARSGTHHAKHKCAQAKRWMAAPIAAEGEALGGDLARDGARPRKEGVPMSQTPTEALRALLALRDDYPAFTDKAKMIDAIEAALDAARAALAAPERVVEVAGCRDCPFLYDTYACAAPGAQAEQVHSDGSAPPDCPLRLAPLLVRLGAGRP
jgi:hypothetical protein